MIKTAPLLLLGLGMLAAPGAAAPAAAPSALAASKPDVLTILSYNVHGLPWPIALHRGLAARQIAQSLKRLREHGQAPQIVVLQEAFGTAQKDIGRLAGYRYSTFGSAAAAVHGPAIAGSGLALFSDFPILWTRKMAFRHCAGLDCLAAKGLLIAAVQRPGDLVPIAIVNTHFNSAGSSGVGKSVSDRAYDRQARALEEALDTIPRDESVIVAGDTNAGHDPRRISSLEPLFGGSNFQVAAAEWSCGKRCRTLAPADAMLFRRSVKTLVLYRSDPASMLTPVQGPIVFGVGPGGRMLSDHIGLIATFSTAAPTTLR